jgi:hypothetical protein
MTTDNIIEFLRLATAAEESPWSVRHLERVLTSDSYSHLDPRPKIRRLPTGGTSVLIRSEWEEFKQRMLDTPKPAKKSRLMEARRQARLDRERVEASA